MKYFQILLLLLVFTFSCKKDEVKEEIPSTEGEVYYISNEGAFGFGNSSVSMYFVDEDLIVNDAFEMANERRPGDVLQSIFINKEKVYLLVNASNKIEVASTKTLDEQKVIQPLVLVRYMEAVSDRYAFVSMWGLGGQVVKIDLEADEILDSIAVGNGPEKMLYVDGKLFVANSGGFKEDSTLSVIDVQSNKVEKELVVGNSPIDIVEGDAGVIWVLCKGSVVYDANWQITGHSPSYIVSVDVSTNAILKKVKLSDEKHPSILEISQDKKYLYYGAGFGFTGIYRYDIHNNLVENTRFIDDEFYGFNVNPLTGNIFGFKSPSFTASGKMAQYSSTGQLIMEKTVGVGPNGIKF